MAELKTRKKAKRASIHGCHFYEEGVKAIGFMGFIGQMASHIDFTRHKAASALYEVGRVIRRGPNNQNFDEHPPIFQPVTTETLEQFDEYVSSLVYVQMVDQMNCYIGNMLHHVFLKNPNMLKSSKTISLEKVLSFTEIRGLHSNLAEEYVQSIMYKSARHLFRYLDEMHGIKPFANPEDLDFFVDCNLKRNLLVHNFGKINKLFLSKCTTPETYILGSTLKIGAKDTFQFIPEAIQFVLKLDKYLCDKFGVPRRLLPSNKIQKRWASFLRQSKKRGRPKMTKPN